MGLLTDTGVSERNLTTSAGPIRGIRDVGEGDQVEWHVRFSGPS